MAREYARIRISTADDPDLEELSLEAQWLYFRVLLPHPLLSSCGVANWHPKHLVRKGRNVTLATILRAAAELERARYLLFDLETDEVLVRSYVRGDEVLKNPKMAGAVIKAYLAVGSRTLQAAVVSEIARVRQEHPEYSSWEYKDTREGLARILSRPDLSTVGYTDAIAVEITDSAVVPIGYPTPVDIADAEAVEIGDRDPGPNSQSDSVDIPSTFSLSPQPAPLGGYVAGVPHEPRVVGENEPPSPHCSQHPGGTLDRCGSCGDARRARERFDVEHARHAAAVRAGETRRQAELRAAAIAHCRLCDAEGYADGRVCDHDPEALERNRRGSAGARIAACRMCDENGLRADNSECDHKLRRGDRSENR